MSSRFSHRSRPSSTAIGRYTPSSSSQQPTTAPSPAFSPSFHQNRQQMSPEVRDALREMKTSQNKKFQKVLRSVTYQDPFRVPDQTRECWSFVHHQNQDSESQSKVISSSTEEVQPASSTDHLHDAARRYQIDLNFDLVDFLEKEGEGGPTNSNNTTASLYHQSLSGDLNTTNSSYDDHNVFIPIKNSPLLNTSSRPKPHLLRLLENHFNRDILLSLRLFRKMQYVLSKEEHDMIENSTSIVTAKRNVRFYQSTNRAAIYLFSLTDEREVLFHEDEQLLDQKYFRIPTRNELTKMPSQKEEGDDHVVENRQEEKQEDQEEEDDNFLNNNADDTDGSSAFDFNQQLFFRYSFHQIRSELFVIASRDRFMNLTVSMRVSLLLFCDDLYTQNPELKKVLIDAVLDCGKAGVAVLRGYGCLILDNNTNYSGDEAKTLLLDESASTNLSIPHPVTFDDQRLFTEEFFPLLVSNNNNNNHNNPSLLAIVKQKQQKITKQASTSWTSCISFAHYPCLSLVQLLSQSVGAALIIPKLNAEHFSCLYDEIHNFQKEYDGASGDDDQHHVVVDSLLLSFLEGMLLYKKGSKSKEIVELANESFAALDTSLSEELETSPTSILQKRLGQKKFELEKEKKIHLQHLEGGRGNKTTNTGPKKELGSKNNYNNNNTSNIASSLLPSASFTLSDGTPFTVYFENHHVKMVDFTSRMLLSKLKSLKKGNNKDNNKDAFLTLWKKVVNLFSSLLLDGRFVSKQRFLFPPSKNLDELKKFLLESASTDLSIPTVSFEEENNGENSIEQHDDKLVNNKSDEDEIPDWIYQPDKERNNTRSHKSSKNDEFTLQLFVSVIRMCLLTNNVQLVHSLFTKVIIAHHQQSPLVVEKEADDEKTKSSISTTNDETINECEDDELLLMTSLERDEGVVPSAENENICETKDNTKSHHQQPPKKKTTTTNIPFLTTSDVTEWTDVTNAALEVSLVHSSSIALTLLQNGLSLLRQMSSLKSLAAFTNLVSLSFTHIFVSSSSYSASEIAGSSSVENSNNNSYSSSSPSTALLLDLFRECRLGIEARLIDLVADANDEIRKSAGYYDPQHQNSRDYHHHEEQNSFSNNYNNNDHRREIYSSEARRLPPPISCSDILAFLKAARKLPDSFSPGGGGGGEGAEQSSSTISHESKTNIFSVVEPVARDAIGSHFTMIREIVNAAVFLADEYDHESNKNRNKSKTINDKSSKNGNEADRLLMDLLLARLLPQGTSLDGGTESSASFCPTIDTSQILPLMKFFVLAAATTAAPSSSSSSNSSSSTAQVFTTDASTVQKIETFLVQNEAAQKLKLDQLDKVVRLFLKYLNGSAEGPFMELVFERWNESARFFPNSNLIFSVLSCLQQVKGKNYMSSSEGSSGLLPDLVKRSIEIVKSL